MAALMLGVALSFVGAAFDQSAHAQSRGDASSAGRTDGSGTSSGSTLSGAPGSSANDRSDGFPVRDLSNGELSLNGRIDGNDTPIIIIVEDWQATQGFDPNGGRPTASGLPTTSGGSPLTVGDRPLTRGESGSSLSNGGRGSPLNDRGEPPLRGASDRSTTQVLNVVGSDASCVSLLGSTHCEFEIR